MGNGAVLMEKDMHNTAMHEAAHAVTAWLSGAILKYITIAGEEQDKPYICTYGRSPWQEKTWLNRDNVHVTLAGAAVHEILGLDDPFQGCNYDLESIADMLNHPDPETKAMREFAVHHPDSTAKEFAELFLPDLVERLRDPKVMTCIEAGAAMLETATGDVCGRLMVELFEHVWGDPLPENAAPAWMHWPPSKDDEAPTQAEAMLMLGKAMDELETAIEATRTAFRFENEAAELLATRTMKHSWWMRDQFQRIEIPLPA
jgi:hypothetical protein